MNATTETQAAHPVVYHHNAALRLLGDSRGVVAFDARCKQIPSVGDCFEYIDLNMRLFRLVAIAAIRPRFGRPQRVVRIVKECGVCHGSGAVEIPGPCPECSGKGCVDCEGAGTIDWSNCPGCNGGR